MAAPPSDLERLVTAQLGRPPRGRWEVAARCPYGFPAVIETEPYLDDGTPFPTLYYLTCPSAVEAVSRQEAAGGVEAFRRNLASDSDAAAAVAGLDAMYRERRRRKVRNVGVDGGNVLEGGIGGPSGPSRATCLHAYVAALLVVTQGEPVVGGREEGGRARDDLVGSWERLLSAFPGLWCADGRCAGLASSGGTRRAAVDVGTNSVRLLVAVAEDGRLLRTLVRRAEVTRLGAGLRPGGTLDPRAADRTREAVGRHVEEAHGLGVGSIHVVGTSACRDAVDGPAFIAGFADDPGVQAEVVSGPREAWLSYLGATYDFGGAHVVIDVGGGSTELVRGAGAPGGPGAADQADEAVDAASLGLGCVRATEAWFTTDPPSVQERAALRRAAREMLVPLASRFGAPRPTEGAARPGASRGSVFECARLVGVAGTVTTLACIVLGLAAYDPEVVHGSVERRELEGALEMLTSMSPEERAALACMQPGRADVIVAGGEILLAAMEVLGWDGLTVSERDILDGVILDDAVRRAAQERRGMG